MICTTCKVAGSINQRGLWFIDHDRRLEADKQFGIASDMHHECEQPNGCNCQHSVGMNLVNARETGEK